jgi:NAD+ diphosphatase
VSHVHIFAGNPLDRADALRRDPEWLDGARADPGSRYLPFARLNVLLCGERPELGWLRSSEVQRLGISVPPIFLGLREGIAHFAIDVSELGDPAHELNLDDSWRFEDCRAAGTVLSVPDSGIVARSGAATSVAAPRAAPSTFPGPIRWPSC